MGAIRRWALAAVGGGLLALSTLLPVLAEGTPRSALLEVALPGVLSLGVLGYGLALARRSAETTRAPRIAAWATGMGLALGALGLGVFVLLAEPAGVTADMVYVTVTEATLTDSVSGVVFRMCGVVSSIACRSAESVSPCRMAWRISTSSPRDSSRSVIPSRGTSRLRWMSLASDFRGET